MIHVPWMLRNQGLSENNAGLWNNLIMNGCHFTFLIAQYVFTYIPDMSRFLLLAFQQNLIRQMQLQAGYQTEAVELEAKRVLDEEPWRIATQYGVAYQVLVTTQQAHRQNMGHMVAQALSQVDQAKQVAVLTQQEERATVAKIVDVFIIIKNVFQYLYCI